jgi:hypothetical protein
MAGMTVAAAALWRQAVAAGGFDNGSSAWGEFGGSASFSSYSGKHGSEHAYSYHEREFLGTPENSYTDHLFPASVYSMFDRPDSGGKGDTEHDFIVGSYRANVLADGKPDDNTVFVHTKVTIDETAVENKIRNSYSGSVPSSGYISASSSGIVIDVNGSTYTNSTQISINWQNGNIYLIGDFSVPGEHDTTIRICPSLGSWSWTP